MFNLKLNLSCKQMPIITPTSVPDPDLEIRRGPSHPDPEIRGWGRGGSLQKFFLALWASVWSKNGRGAGPPRAPPLGPLLNIGRSGGEYYTVGVLVQKFAFSESIFNKVLRT